MVLFRQFSGCGKIRPDIPNHIPRIPLGTARVPGEVCSVFILPSVAPNPPLHTGREEKTKTFRKRTSPTSSSLPHIQESNTVCTYVFKYDPMPKVGGVHPRLCLGRQREDGFLLRTVVGQIIHAAINGGIVSCVI